MYTYNAYIYRYTLYIITHNYICICTYIYIHTCMYYCIRVYTAHVYRFVLFIPYVYISIYLHIIMYNIV